MNLGIVLVTYRCQELALACLESIEANLPGQIERIAIVDNASGDGTLEAIRARFPAVRTAQNRANVGFAGGANAGIKLLDDCDVICLLNPDSLVLDGGLADAARYLDEHPELGLSGGRIVNLDGSLQPSCRAFPGHRTAIFNGHSLATKLLPRNRFSSEYLMSNWSHDEPRTVDWVSGACMLIHRRALERVGPLDDGYFWSIEDVDYCRRAHYTGLGVVYYPGACIQHLVGGSSRHAAYRAMTAHHRGMWRYYRRHMRGGRLLDLLTAAGIAGRLGIHAASYMVRRGLTGLRAGGRPASAPRAPRTPGGAPGA